MYSNKENVNILTALLVKHGVEHVVVCPGSRNAPLVHNFNECPDMVCHPVTDERSAGFIALGMTQQLGHPVAVCVTSGSALLNVLPAVAEATYQHRGIIVISADRPAAWIDQLDGQTCPQQGALGRFVAKSVTLPEVSGDRFQVPGSRFQISGDKDQRWHCNRLINEAMLAFGRPGHPSVHINVPISEPLFEFNVAELPDERGVACFLWSDDMYKEMIIRKIAQVKKPMFVIGQTGEYDIPDDYLYELSQCFVILTEPLTGGELSQSFTDQMLYAIEKHPKAYQPDLVIYMGGHTVSKRLRHFLRSLGDDTMQMIVSADGSLHDVSQKTRIVIEGSMSQIVSDINCYLNHNARPSAFYKKWSALREEVRKKHEAYEPEYSQMLAVKLFEKELELQDDECNAVYYANSMSVRLAALYAKHYCHCNRGLNGIEGSLSVAAGAALAQAYFNQTDVTTNTHHPSPNTYCVIGDLSFFYDENALWQQELGGNFRIMLLNNGQGGIFRNLKGLDKSPVRDTLVSASHNTSAEGICKQFNVKYLKATDEMSLQRGVMELTNMNSKRPVLLEVFTDVDADEEQFKQYYHNLIR